MGFFHESELLSEPEQSRIAKCGICKLKDSCESPLLSRRGEGRKKVLILTDFPTQGEDQRGKWLAGKVGQWISEKLEGIGLNLDRDCWTCGAIWCRPEAKTNLPKVAEYCYPNVMGLLDTLNPVAVICFGELAVRAVVRYAYQSAPSSTQTYLGWKIPAQVGNMWVMGTYHPRLILDQKKRTTHELFMTKHLAQFDGDTIERPYAEVPDYKNRVQLLWTPSEVSDAMADMSKSKGITALDYETNMLKPDGEDAKILSVSVSDGERSVAFMLTDKTMRPVAKYLRSKAKKTACNIKFETRWSRACLGISPRNWVWCSLQGAHIIQSAPAEFTSLKNQSFVHLGQPRYNAQVDSLLEANGTRLPNKAAEEIEPRQLLEYNGMDTICEWHVGDIQRKMLRVKV